MDKAYFQLFACCIPVRGALKFIICDLQRGRIQAIPESLYVILTEYKTQSSEALKAIFEHQWDEQIDEYFHFLEAEEWGFWCDDPTRFPSLDLSWDSPALITNAIIDINPLSNHPYKKIFEELHYLGCQALQLRSFGQVSKQQLVNILDQVGDHRLKAIELVIKYDNAFAPQPMTELCRQYPRICSITLHTAPYDRESIDDYQLQLNYTTQAIDSAAHCGFIDPYYFVSNIAAFTESQQHNSCLNRKIAIDEDGFIKNCPSMKTHFGHISHTSLLEVLEQEQFKAPWSISKDQIAICKDCEYRYVCTDCRAYTVAGETYSKPEKCSYNPYTGVWE